MKISVLISNFVINKRMNKWFQKQWHSRPATQQHTVQSAALGRTKASNCKALTWELNLWAMKVQHQVAILCKVKSKSQQLSPIVYSKVYFINNLLQ